MAETIREKASLATKLAIGAAIVQVIAAIGAFLSKTFDGAALIMLFALVGIAALVATGVAWGQANGLRRALRIAFVALPSAVALIGVVCAVSTALFDLSVTHPMNLSMSAPDSLFSYTLGFDMAVTLSYAQMIVLFLFPAMVLAASFGERCDRLTLYILSVAHLAVMVLNVFVFSQDYFVPTWNTIVDYVPTWEHGTMEITVVQLVMLGITVIFTALSLFVGFPQKKTPTDAAS